MKHNLIDIPQYEGLVECTICGGAEGDLPTECPGRKMTSEEKEAIFTGKLNFISSMWFPSKEVTL